MLDTLIDDFLDGIDVFHPKFLTSHLAAPKHQAKTDEIKKALGQRGFQYERMLFKSEGLPDARFRVWRKAPPVGRNFRSLTPEEKHELMSTEAATY